MRGANAAGVILFCPMPGIIEMKRMRPMRRRRHEKFRGGKRLLFPQADKAKKRGMRCGNAGCGLGVE